MGVHDTRGENDRESIRSVNYDRKMLWQMVAVAAHTWYIGKSIGKPNINQVCTTLLP